MGEDRLRSSPFYPKCIIGIWVYINLLVNQQYVYHFNATVFKRVAASDISYTAVYVYEVCI